MRIGIAICFYGCIAWGVDVANLSGLQLPCQEALLHYAGLRHGCPPLTSGPADDLGVAEGVEAVHEGDADVDFSDLAVRVSRHDALAEGFSAAHSRSDPAVGVVSGPSLPERPPVVSGRAQGVVSGACRGQSSFHSRPFLRIGMIGTASRSMMAV